MLTVVAMANSTRSRVHAGSYGRPSNGLQWLDLCLRLLFAVILLVNFVFMLVVMISGTSQDGDLMWVWCAISMIGILFGTLSVTTENIVCGVLFVIVFTVTSALGKANWLNWSTSWTVCVTEPVLYLIVLLIRDKTNLLPVPARSRHSSRRMSTKNSRNSAKIYGLDIKS